MTAPTIADQVFVYIDTLDRTEALDALECLLRAHVVLMNDRSMPTTAASLAVLWSLAFRARGGRLGTARGADKHTHTVCSELNAYLLRIMTEAARGSL